jgi:sterol desaturase/sphingolipid hydroxylase (fatty acid hydroxylase superfamily)
METALFWIAVALVAITSSARLTRLITIDKFPPIKWARDKFENATDGSNWQLLTMCGYCMSVWTTIGVVLWGYLALWDNTWWLINSILGAAYLAAILVRHDGDDDEPAPSEITPTTMTGRVL